MGVQKERKSTFFTAFKRREKHFLISQLCLNIFVIGKLNITYNPQIFVVANRF